VASTPAVVAFPKIKVVGMTGSAVVFFISSQ
jgi:hypothetical protein